MTIHQLNKDYKIPKTTAGDLNIPVIFYQFVPRDGPEPGEEVKRELYRCNAEVYDPSMKDREILQSHETKLAVTIKIRDTRGQYLPTNQHHVEIKDSRYATKVWDVIDTRPDFKDDRFIIMILGCTE